jgi:hypothetical protein
MKSEAICASLHLVPLITGAVRDDRVFSRTDGPIARTVRCFQRLSDIGIQFGFFVVFLAVGFYARCRKQNADRFLALVRSIRLQRLQSGLISER